MSIRSNLIYYAIDKGDTYVPKPIETTLSAQPIISIPGMVFGKALNQAPSYDGGFLKVGQNRTTGDIMVVTNSYMSTDNSFGNYSSMIAIVRQDGSICYRVRADRLFDIIYERNSDTRSRAYSVYISDIIPWKGDSFLLVGGVKETSGTNEPWYGLRMLVTGIRDTKETSLRPLSLWIDMVNSTTSLIWSSGYSSQFAAPMATGSAPIKTRSVFLAGVSWTSALSVIPLGAKFVSRTQLTSAYTWDEQPGSYNEPIYQKDNYGGLNISSDCPRSVSGASTYSSYANALDASGPSFRNASSWRAYMRQWSTGIARNYSATVLGSSSPNGPSLHFYTPNVGNWKLSWGSSNPKDDVVVTGDPPYIGLGLNNRIVFNPSTPAASGGSMSFEFEGKFAATLKLTGVWDGTRMSKKSSNETEFAIIPNYSWGFAGFVLLSGTNFSIAQNSGNVAAAVGYIDPVTKALVGMRLMKTSNVAGNAFPVAAVAGCPYTYDGPNSFNLVRRSSGGALVPGLLSNGMIGAFAVSSGEVLIRAFVPNTQFLNSATVIPQFRASNYEKLYAFSFTDTATAEYGSRQYTTDTENEFTTPLNNALVVNISYTDDGMMEQVPLTIHETINNANTPITITE